jgi:hypothetical protein
VHRCPLFALPAAFACLVSSPARAAAPEVLIAASVDGQVAADGPVMAKAGQIVKLYAVLAVGQGKARRFVSAAPGLRLRGQAVPASRRRVPDAELRFAWSLVEPYPHHVNLAPPNPGNPAYSNAQLFGPNHGGWLGYDTIEYHETLLPNETGAELVVTRVAPTDAHVNVHGGLGTMRYKVTVSGPEPGGPTGATFTGASPGSEAREEHGIARRVMRVSFRRGDDLPGLLTAFYNVPNVFGSGGTGEKHQTDMFQGADCADVIIGAMRAVGVRLSYSSVKGLFAHARPVTPRVLLDEDGVHSLVDGKAGEPVHLRFGDDVQPGDIMLIDYVSAGSNLPRTWDHVAIVSGDAGTKEEFDPSDPVMHMGYLFGLTEGPAVSEAPAIIQFLRWKPSVTVALMRASRKGGRAVKPGVPE